MTPGKAPADDGMRTRLGAHPALGGTWFTVEAPNAQLVELCLFKPGSARERQRLVMQRTEDGQRFSVFAPGVAPGTEYGYRVHGPYAPDEGHLFNARKVLVDPWARAVSGPLSFHPSQRTTRGAGGAQSDDPDPTDSAAAMLRSVVTDEAPLRALLAAAPARPRVAEKDMVLYECHVRGMTAAHPDVPPEQRGTYLGLCHEALLSHLKALSVTTVSLMPVAEYFDEEHLTVRGLTNYWGYAPLAYFAPSRRYATPGGDPQVEFRTMVDTLHRAGLEVVVDVVFNHNAEGDLRGTTLCLRGLDNRAYFATRQKPPHRNVDYTGCGNSLDLSQPSALRFTMDALRYWVEVLGVDGFRFDLAVTLARTPQGFSPRSPFLAAIGQDPVLRHCKLIAEPWDVGPQGYRLGGFPPGFSEWNDRYRDGLRRAFRGGGRPLAELATRLAGSSDLFDSVGRGPQASVNFVTSHDGFTLRDLVSYEHKHNEDNGEDNRDGHGDNHSQNFGHEGPTDHAEIEYARKTCARAMLLCTALAQGAPMIAHGDELGRTQRGNNNAYCHDSDLTHVDWRGPWRRDMLFFAQAAFAMRARHACLRPARHLHGELLGGRPDLSWLRADGREMKAADWRGQHVAMRVCGERGDGVLLLINVGREPVWFTLPAPDAGFRWYTCLDAARGEPCNAPAATALEVVPRSATALEMRSMS